MTILGVMPGQLVLVFIIAIAVTALELITSKFPQTFVFALRSPWFYSYVLIYGLLGVAALALLPFVADQIKGEGGILSDPWVKAGLVGLSIKAILHIRILTVTTGPGQSFPIGLETFVQLFEPWMIKSLELDHYYQVKAFIGPRAAAHPNVDDARAQAKANIPSGFNDNEKAALTSDIDSAKTSAEVISNYLKYAGVKLTRAAFP